MCRILNWLLYQIFVLVLVKSGSFKLAYGFWFPFVECFDLLIWFYHSKTWIVCQCWRKILKEEFCFNKELTNDKTVSIITIRTFTVHEVAPIVLKLAAQNRFTTCIRMHLAWDQLNTFEISPSFTKCSSFFFQFSNISILCIFSLAICGLNKYVDR